MCPLRLRWLNAIDDDPMRLPRKSKDKNVACRSGRLDFLPRAAFGIPELGHCPSPSQLAGAFRLLNLPIDHVTRVVQPEEGDQLQAAGFGRANHGRRLVGERPF